MHFLIYLQLKYLDFHLHSQYLFTCTFSRYQVNLVHQLQKEVTFEFCFLNPSKNTCYSRWSGKDTATMWVWNHQHAHTFSSITTTSGVPHKVREGKWQWPWRGRFESVEVNYGRRLRSKLLPILPSYIYDLQSYWRKGLVFFFFISII